MTAHALTHEAEERSTPRRVSRNGVFQLSWLHFWLLIAILGMMLALVGLVFFAQSSL